MAISKESENIINIGVKALENKKADNVKVIDISEISVIADALVIASGNNSNQIQAMADEVEQDLGKQNIHFLSHEGYDKANWILMDYNDVIFHLFDKDSRNFYDLERLYRDGKSIEDLLLNM